MAAGSGQPGPLRCEAMLRRRRGEHELLRAFGPKRRRVQQPIQERRLHRARHQCQLTRTTGFILAPSSAATRVSSRTRALILAYAQNIGWTYVPKAAAVAIASKPPR